ncbi:MAG: hypothetical protein RLZZ528_2451 [Pseudomonadota bacterium]|jgi:SH3-like domain-containing protein
MLRTILAVAALSCAVSAAGAEEEVMPVAVTKGSVTNMDLPRFVSLKGSEGNVRRGPSLEHRIDWVFRHRDMPLMVTAEFGHWRRVEDQDGQGGWIHYALLSGVRTVVVSSETADLHVRPGEDTPVLARAEAGVVGRLGACDMDWCKIAAGGEKGWVRKSDIWGVMRDEVRE